MKKFVGILIAIIMIIVVSACGTSEESKKPIDKKTVNTYTLENETIIDNEYCSVVFVKCEEKSNSVDLRFLLENKTEDKTVMFAMEDTAVNGWLITSLFANTVAAGKKSNKEFSIDKDELKNLGITNVDKFAFSMRVYDSNDWSAEKYVEQSFEIYPTGLTDFEIVSPNRPRTDDEMSFIDNQECSFAILGTYDDEIWGYTVVVYLENKTDDKNLMFSWDDVSVNGFMIDPFWASSVSAGNKKITTLNFEYSDFEKNGITSADEIEFVLNVHDSDNIFADYIVKDTFKYSISK